MSKLIPGRIIEQSWDPFFTCIVTDETGYPLFDVGGRTFEDCQANVNLLLKATEREQLLQEMLEALKKWEETMRLEFESGRSTAAFWDNIEATQALRAKAEGREG